MTREVRGMAPPPRALLFSLLSLSVPILGTTVLPGLAEEEYGVLLWLTALIPALLLTYYRGWKGASLALVLGMLALAITQVMIVSFGTGRPDWSILLVVVAVYLVLSVGIGVMGEILLRQRLSAEGMALTDPLTNLPNRRHATVFLEAAVAGAERGVPVSVVLFDIDHFKSFNDTYGHAAGDEVLKVFGEVMAGSTRRMDLAARFGGEEFLAVLRQSGAEEARGYAERIRSGLRECERTWGPVTVSAGIAQYEGGRDELRRPPGGRGGPGTVQSKGGRAGSSRAGQRAQVDRAEVRHRRR